MNLFYQPLVAYQGWFAWFNRLDPDKKYRCFSMIDIAYYNSSNLLYDIKVLFTPGSSTFKNDSWIQFITSLMWSQAKTIVPNGILTPQALCDTIVPTAHPELPLEDGSGLNWPVSEEDWRKLIKAWVFKDGFDPSGATDDSINANLDADKWTTSQNNFFFQLYAIPYNSPLIIGFTTNRTTYGGYPVEGKAVLPLVGKYSGIEHGGWFGFLQEGGNFNNEGLFGIQRILWSNDVPQSMTSGKDPVKKCSTNAKFGAAMSGISTAAAFGMLLAPFTAGASLAVTAGVIATGAAVGGVAGGMLSAGQSGCL